MLFEHGCQVLQLIGGERPLVLADHDRVEPAIWVVERGQQRSGLRTHSYEGSSWPRRTGSPLALV
ncbi:hypothetical protein ACGFIE_25415 [Micromonospora sp. NPDC049275]|uniref:hypothetical protein n=1 Tax=Micromonospora sp. NPDC049275 TaxID=3364268 RepID=UPI0037248A89